MELITLTLGPGDKLALGLGETNLQARVLEKTDFQTFNTWLGTYQKLLENSQNRDALLALGRELVAWLDQILDGHFSHALSQCAGSPVFLELRVAAKPGAGELLFLEQPWEILANDGGFLAADPQTKLCPVRRIGKAQAPQDPSPIRLNLLFMAAAPRNSRELDFEREEVAIYNATGQIGLDLTVEESGNVVQLKETFRSMDGADVLHLSCHGDNKPRPVLILESEGGDPEPVDPTTLEMHLAGKMPRLLFVSACKTGQMGGNPEALLNSYACQMIQLNAPAVLGWGGAVFDHEASAFAAGLYGQLAQHLSLREAVARARFNLIHLEQEGHKSAKHWHLARLYLGPSGGGVLCAGSQARRLQDREYGHKEFLDPKNQKVPVASREEFVGRRRQIQDILRPFRSGDNRAVLIHGVGRQGKSSLAARVANRMAAHQVVVVFGDYSMAAILRAISAAYRQFPEVQALLGEGVLQKIDENPGEFPGLLMQLLTGPLREKQDRLLPLLLVLDDLEQILDAPGQGSGTAHRVNPLFQPMLRAVLQAFSSAESRSRLLLTSRFEFVLNDAQGTPLRDTYLSLALPSMSDKESRKQFYAKLLKARFPQSFVTENPAYLPLLSERMRRVSGGNPGLQDRLHHIAMEALSHTPPNIETVDNVLDEMEAYLKGGKLPEHQAVQDYFANLALGQLIGYLNPTQREVLRSLSLFGVPAPERVLAVLAQEIAGTENAQTALERLQQLGLLERYEDLFDSSQTAGMLNPLCRAQLGEAPLNEKEQQAFAALVVDPLFRAWGGPAGRDKRPAIADFELARLAVVGDNPEVVGATARDALGFQEENFGFRGAAAFAHPVLAFFEAKKIVPPTAFVFKASEVLNYAGEARQAHRLLLGIRESGLESDLAPEDRAGFYVRLGRLQVNRGEIEEALDHFQEAQNTFESLGDKRSKAVTMGDIAGILLSKGEVEQALKLHQGKMEIMESLGDKREKAIAMGDIARILLSKGEVEQALKLHQERIEVFESLGDKRSKAITMGDIAGILKSKGEVEQALKLHQEEMDVYESLGDKDSLAVTMWDMARNEISRENWQAAFENLDKAYRINLQLGRLDGIAFVGVDLGVLLCRAGQKEPGLEILERSRQGFTKLGQRPMAQQCQQLIEQFSK